jgi:hypothetical protein
MNESLMSKYMDISEVRVIVTIWTRNRDLEFSRTINHEAKLNRRVEDVKFVYDHVHIMGLVLGTLFLRGVAHSWFNESCFECFVRFENVEFITLSAKSTAYRKLGMDSIR